MPLTLYDRPDAYGWLYGSYVSPMGEHVRVDIMPPASHWAGDIQLEGYEPHATEWVLYAEGEEIARVTERAAIEAAVAASRTE